MALEVIMPKAGVDMTEGQIVQWNKKVGEFVKEGEILLEIMTDKVSMELEAEEALENAGAGPRLWKNSAGRNLPADSKGAGRQ